MGLAAVAPVPHTSRPHPQHPKYPYLPRGKVIDRPNQGLVDRYTAVPSVVRSKNEAVYRSRIIAE